MDTMDLVSGEDIDQAGQTLELTHNGRFENRSGSKLEDLEASKYQTQRLVGKKLTQPASSEHDHGCIMYGVLQVTPHAHLTKPRISIRMNLPPSVIPQLSTRVGQRPAGNCTPGPQQQPLCGPCAGEKRRTW